MQHVGGGGPKSKSLLDNFPQYDRDLELAESLGLTLAAFDALPDGERDLWVARWERARERCPRCGHGRDVCGDAHRDWFPQQNVCYATMAQQAAQAKWERLHNDAPWHDGTFSSWAKEPSDAHPFHMSHGVTIWVAESDLTPDDDFLTSRPVAR